jgi:hypothetical protein
MLEIHTLFLINDNPKLPLPEMVKQVPKKDKNQLQI